MPGFVFVEKKGSAPQSPPALPKSEQPRSGIVKKLLSQKENPKGDAYLKDCVICRNDAKVTISQSTPVPAPSSEKPKEVANPKTEPTAKQDSKETAPTKKNESDHLKNEIKAEKTLAKESIRENNKESKNNIPHVNNTPPQKTKAETQNKTQVLTEKVSSEKQPLDSQVSNKISENKTVSPVMVTTAQNNTSESKMVLQNITASLQTVSSNPTQISSTAPAILINPAPQINVIPQVVPILNTVLLTQLIPQRPVISGNEVRSFGDFLPTKNNKQNVIDPEKFQFSTPLISTKVLAQILANKDTTSLNALRAILHLFGREIDKEKEDTDLEGSYGLWKEYLKKIKRKKSKQASSQNRQQKTQSFNMEELGIRS